jgi:hypothetical protein
VADVGGRETKGGLVQVMMTLDPDHLRVLREEAERRAKERKRARSDVSEIVREAVAAWVAAHAKGRAKS